MAQISLFLTQHNKSTGVDTVVWNGTQNPTVEVDNVGVYTRILATADLTTYDYFAMAEYTGAVVLDTNYAYGQVSEVEADSSLIWSYASRTLTSFGTLISDIFSHVLSNSLTFAQTIVAIWTKVTGGTTAPVDFTYTVRNSQTNAPIEGVQVWFFTESDGSNLIWYGVTDSFGVARDSHNNLPRLDPGTYYIKTQRGGYTPDDFLDVETVA